MDAASVPERHPLRIAAVAAAVTLLLLAAGAAALFLWLRSYEPLDADGAFAPGPHLAADVQPVTGSGGRPVLIPAYRRGRAFDTAFTLRNTGRFAVEISGLGADVSSRALKPVTLLTTDSSTASADPDHLHPFRRLRLDRGDRAILVVRWQLDCTDATRDVFADSVPLRYDYLSLFTRTERVELPYAVTLRCSG
jgi:hypothetical protein